jgi:hypothetical protein
VFFDSVFPSSAGSTFNLEAFDSKPTSSPPIPSKAFDIIDDPGNQRTARMLNYVLGQMRITDHPLYIMAGLVAGFIKPMQADELDHGAVRRWRKGETATDRYRADLFDRTVIRMEEILEETWPKVSIQVNISRKDEPVESKIHARNQDNNDQRKWAAHNKFLALYAELDELMAENECGIEAAIGLLRDRREKEGKPDVSPRTCYRARSFVAEQRQGIKSRETREELGEITA